MPGNIALEGLTIPAQKRPDETSFDTRPKFIQKWIANLPMANLGETSRRVFKAMVEINRLQLPVQDRYQLLEALREPCQYVTTCLEKYFAGRPLPLNEKNRKVSELARALTSELAMGYKIVARQLVTSDKRPDQKLLLSALHRATSYLGLLLLRSYQVYAPYPRNVWRELHTIYRYAEGQRLLSSPLEDNMRPLSGTNGTIGTMYNTILMLSLAMPYRLHRGEINKVCALLNSLVHQVSLEKIPSWQIPQGLFIVNLHEDKQPGYLSMYQGNDFHDCRLVNTTDLVMNMQDRISKADTELTSLASMDLLQRLLSSWSIMSKRSFSRAPKQEAHVDVAFGISAVHHYISGERPFISDTEENKEFSPQGSRQSEFYSSQVRAVSSQRRGPDVWNKSYTYSANDPTTTTPHTTTLNARASHVQSFDFKSIRLGISNISASGYCLVSQTDTSFSAHVGDLLAIREYNDKNTGQWSVGIVRRMMSLSNASIQLGIHILTPDAVAVAARLVGTNGDVHRSELMRCLMLPEQHAIDQPATIITPTLPFKQDSHIRINLQDKQILAVLTRQLESTRSFSQFEFRVLSEAKPEQPVTDPADTGLDFNSLWATL